MQTGNTLIQFGLVVYPYSPYLGASPDGFVHDQETVAYGALEVKGSTSKKFSSLDQALKTKNFYFTNDKNNVPTSLKNAPSVLFSNSGANVSLWDFCVYFQQTGQL